MQSQMPGYNVFGGQPAMTGPDATVAENFGRGLGLQDYSQTQTQNFTGFDGKQIDDSAPDPGALSYGSTTTEAPSGTTAGAPAAGTTGTGTTGSAPSATSTADNNTSVDTMGSTPPSGMLSGFGSFLSGMLSYAGAPASVVGTGDNSPNGATERYLDNLLGIPPSDSSSTSTSSSSSSTGSTTPSPYDDAMAAYLATMAADGTQSSGVTTSGTSGTSSSNLGVTRSLLNNRLYRAPIQPLYRPMEDPTVLRALGLI